MCGLRPLCEVSYTFKFENGIKENGLCVFYKIQKILYLYVVFYLVC